MITIQFSVDFALLVMNTIGVLLSQHF